MVRGIGARWRWRWRNLWTLTRTRSRSIDRSIVRRNGYRLNHARNHLNENVAARKLATVLFFRDSHSRFEFMFIADIWHVKIKAWLMPQPSAGSDFLRLLALHWNRNWKFAHRICSKISIFSFSRLSWGLVCGTLGGNRLNACGKLN